jgi:Secretion system C-terminal sorting domain
MKYIVSALICLVAITTNAQVKFKLQLLADQKTYQVSIIPGATFSSPLNLTSTAQITLVVPTGGFEPKNVHSMQSDVQFHFNSRTDAPSENLSFDYVSVGLKSLGTAGLKYQNGLEIALFTFENALPCSGNISLLDHSTDAFFKNPNKKANIGNYISIYGAQGDAYTGNIGHGQVVCSSVPGTSTQTGVADFTLSPNPFTTDLQFGANWKNAVSEAKITLTDALGKVVFEQQFVASIGKNTVDMELAHLAPGLYAVTLITDDNPVYSRKIVKIDQ